MSEIIVKQAAGGKWGAYVGDKVIAVGKCQPCVVVAVRSVTKKSSKYDKIIVFNADGTLNCTLPTGDGHGRTAAKDL